MSPIVMVFSEVLKLHKNILSVNYFSRAVTMFSGKSGKQSIFLPILFFG